MSVEALNHAMTYVIEAWMISSGIYLGVGFTLSLVRRIREDLAAEAQATTAQAEQIEAEQVEVTQTEAEQIEAKDAERLAEVSAVTQQYVKPAKAESVSVSITEG